MIRYISHEHIDREAWDRCVRYSGNGLVYALSWYLDICTPSWDALVMDDYQAVMPLPNRKKYRLHYVYQPKFIQQLGVFSPGNTGASLTSKFLLALPYKFRYIDYSLNSLNHLPAGFTSTLIQARPNFELSLQAPYETLKGTYSVNTRRNLRKAENARLFISDQGRPEEIIQAFRLHHVKGRRAFDKTDYLRLKHLIYQGLHRGIADVRTAYSSDNNFLAGIVFFRFNGRSILLFSGNSPEGYLKRAMFFLVDQYIREQAGKLAVLDFEGSSDQQLARFYRGFGSKECVFLRVVQNKLPWWVRPALSIRRILSS